MEVWGAAAALYGAVLAGAAVSGGARKGFADGAKGADVPFNSAVSRLPRTKRRRVAMVGSIAYAVAGIASGTMATSTASNLLAPGALLLAGYWLSGLFVFSPRPDLEAWLLRLDSAVGADRWASRLPRPVLALLELSYLSVYVVVGGGAMVAAAAGGADQVSSYWNLVLTTELAAYVTIPWVQSRPPRALEEPNLTRRENGWIRRLNTAVLDAASIQANTLPSGHVSGAVAAAVALMPVDARLGVLTICVAALIAIGAVVGRYHYVVDSVSGALTAGAVWLLLRALG